MLVIVTYSGAASVATWVKWCEATAKAAAITSWHASAPRRGPRRSSGRSRASRTSSRWAVRRFRLATWTSTATSICWTAWGCGSVIAAAEPAAVLGPLGPRRHIAARASAHRVGLLPRQLVDCRRHRRRWHPRLRRLIQPYDGALPTKIEIRSGRTSRCSDSSPAPSATGFARPSAATSTSTATASPT